MFSLCHAGDKRKKYYFCIFFFQRATTHTDLVLRAHQMGIQYQVIHNASIMNAVGCCGLQVVITKL